MVSLPRPTHIIVTNVITVVRGEALCLADGWGFSHPVPSTTVLVFDRSPQGPTSNTALGGDATNLDGSFGITVMADLRGIPWSLDLFNDFTGQRFVKNAANVVARPLVTRLSAQRSHVEWDAGQMLIPWDPLLPPLARVGNREFVYHMDLARALAIELKQQQSSAVFLEEFDPSSPHRNAELDSIFVALEMASAGSAADPTGRIAGEVSRLLNIHFAKVRAPEDVFGLALEQIAQMSIRQVHRQDLGNDLGKAIARAVGAPSWPTGSFRGVVPELAAACVLLYVAGHVAKKRKVQMGLSGSSVQRFPHKERHFHETETTVH